MKKGFLLIFLVAFLFIGAAHFSKAITVGPVKLEFNADPGQTITGEMFLKNDDNQPETFYPSFQMFTEKNGERVFLDNPSDLQSWFKVPESVKLVPNGNQTIPFSIAVPNDAPPGGHFAVFWWSTAPPSSGGQAVVISARAGILVYLRVSGDIKESGSLVLSGPRFALGFPINFVSNFTDTGNVELTPQGSLEIRNIFGGLADSLPFNHGGLIILPQSSNSFNLNWQSNGWYFGLYKVVLNVSYGQSNQAASQSYWLFLISWNVLLIIIAIIILVIVLPWFVRRYNNWIIKKARGSA